MSVHNWTPSAITDAFERWKRGLGQGYPPPESIFEAGFEAGAQWVEHDETHWGQDRDCYWCVTEHPEPPPKRGRFWK